MKKLTLMAAVALMGAVFAQAPREAGPRPQHGGPHGAMMDPVVRMVTNPKMAEKLAITPEQQEKLDACLKGGREQASARQKKLRDAMQRQMSLLEAEKVDEAAVMTAIDEVFDIRKEMAKDQTRRMIAVKSILTPEQIAKGFEELKQQREMHRENRGRGPRPNGDRPGRRRGPGAGNPPPSEK